MPEKSLATECIVNTKLIYIAHSNVDVIHVLLCMFMVRKWVDTRSVFIGNALNNACPYSVGAL